MDKNNLIKNVDFVKFLNEVNAKINATKNSKVVYSANFGSYDNLTDPLFIDKEIDYIYFTDNPEIESSVWKIILVEKCPFDSRMTARIIKHMPHAFLSKYNSSLWVDAQLKIDKAPLKVLFSELDNSDFICFRHWRRNRLYLEALSCIKNGHDSVYKISSQYFKYKYNGYIDDKALIASGVLLRRHMNKNIISFQEKWMNQIYGESIRDQLSFNYVAFNENLQYSIFNDDMLDIFTQLDHQNYGTYENGNFSVPIQRRIYNLLVYLKIK